MGASSRSSISRVHEKSSTSGSVVFCSAPRKPFMATMPGSSTAAKSPCTKPMSPRTLPKMKRMKNGWISTCARKLGSSLPVTKTSRQRIARNVRIETDAGVALIGVPCPSSG
jgi:hypothetical protein